MSASNPFQPARKSQKPPPKGEPGQAPQRDGNPFGNTRGPQQAQNPFGQPRGKSESGIRLAYYPKEEAKNLLESHFTGRMKPIGDPNMKFGECIVNAPYKDVQVFIQSVNRPNEGSEDKRIFISMFDVAAGRQSAAFLDANFPEMMRGDGTLDISEVSPGMIDFSNVTTFGFFFYLLAIYCYEERFNVLQIVCERNNLNDEHMRYLSHLRTPFPNLTRVYIDGNNITRESSLDGIEFTMEPWRSYAGVRVSPLEIAMDKDIKLRRVFKLEQYAPLKLDPSASPVTYFLVNFFECSWRNIGDIHRFYEKDKSEFSITIDVCRKGSALYKQFAGVNCNWLREKSVVYVGAEDIGAHQRSLFPQGFQAHPTSFSWCGLGPNLCGVVVRGAFQRGGAVFLFHRSFTLRAAEGIAIVADNMYIQEPR